MMTMGGPAAAVVVSERGTSAGEAGMARYVVQRILRSLCMDSSRGSVGRNSRGEARYGPDPAAGKSTRSPKSRPILLFVALLMLAASVGCSGATAFHGAWEGGLGFSFPLAVQTDSDTYSRLRLAYTVSDWTFDSLTTFNISGLLSQRFGGSGALGPLALNSQLLFSPAPGSALISYSKTTSAMLEHRYDLGVSRFVDWVSVTAIGMDTSADTWRIGTSDDGITWDWVPGVFTQGDVPSGDFSVGAVVRYISIIATSGHIDTSSVLISVSAQAWTTNVRLVTDGVTLYGTLTIASGASGLTLGIIGSFGNNLPVTGRLSFIMAQPSCSFCFDRFEGTFGFALGCLDQVTATLKMRNPQTASQSAFEEFSLSTTGLDLGLLGITFDARLAFELAEKTVTLTPALNLGTGTCFTVYASLGSGTAGPWEITSLSIYGIRILQTWDGVSFESLSYLDDLHHVKDTYWERFTIKSVGGDACCAERIEFSVSAYFEKTGLSLFDLAETEASLSFGLTDALTIRLKAVVASQAGPEELVFGWSLSW